MNEVKIEHCLVFLSDAAFSVLAEIPVDNELKAELLKGALPQGSKWKMYAGMRSISFFLLKSLPKMYALSYSVVTTSIVTPIVSFIIILNRHESEKIITHQISGIENAFIRRIDIFASLDNNNTELLRDSLIYYKALEKPANISEPKRSSESKQTVFTAIYNDQCQWQVVEAKVLEKSAKSLLSFRTFAIQKEHSFQVLGLVVSADDNNKTQLSNSRALIIVAVLTLISVITICLFVLLIMQQVSR